MDPFHLTSGDEYELKKLCFIFESITDPPHIFISPDPGGGVGLKSYVLSPESGKLFLEATLDAQTPPMPLKLRVKQDPDFDWPSDPNTIALTVRQGVLIPDGLTGLQVTRMGTGIGIADIRDFTIPATIHIFHLTDYPMAIYVNVTAEGKKFLNFEFQSFHGDSNNPLVRQNPFYDYFTIGSDEC